MPAGEFSYMFCAVLAPGSDVPEYLKDIEGDVPKVYSRGGQSVAMSVRDMVAMVTVRNMYLEYAIVHVKKQVTLKEEFPAGIKLMYVTVFGQAYKDEVAVNIKRVAFDGVETTYTLEDDAQVSLADDREVNIKRVVKATIMGSGLTMKRAFEIAELFVQ